MKLDRLIIEERNVNKNKVKEFLQELLNRVCVDSYLVDVTSYSFNYPYDELKFESSILDKDNFYIFGSELSFSYNLNSRELKMNCASVGSVSRVQNIGKYYCDILKGQVWLHEDELCKLLDSLEWKYVISN